MCCSSLAVWVVTDEGSQWTSGCPIAKKSHGLVGLVCFGCVSWVGW